MATVTRLIRDGVGVAVLPQVVVQEYLEKGELRILDVDARLPPLHFHVAFADEFVDLALHSIPRALVLVELVEGADGRPDSRRD